MKIPDVIDICGIEHRIVFVGEARMSKESGYAAAEGCVDRDRGIIYLAKSLRKHPTRLRDTIIHEVLGHALLDASGLGYWLRQRMHLGGDKKYDQWVEAQETLIRWYTPALVTTLVSMNLLTEKKK